MAAVSVKRSIPQPRQHAYIASCSWLTLSLRITFIKRGLLKMKERTDYVQNNLPLLSTISLLNVFFRFRVLRRLS